eukprot:CAMPEP_0119003968 /NCGR_PEP_ID=MMETSP1176-20130426/870_1 /TAXON_ID=265551 /ORGANISM="Synedropsis recta cf, Strain CCMP1620" /LENGTH=396 /DNA_ID=CAMNT_0006955619 /DNA_START=42 /DNA_END=1232 /DNA_ORIENTATION=-
MMKMKRRLVAILCYCCLLGGAQAGIADSIRSIGKTVKEIDINPFDDEGYDAKPFNEVFYPSVRSLLIAIYGSSLVLFSHHTPGQIHVMTMFRATGQDKLEHAAEAWKRNFRDAKFAIVKRAPSFIMARQSIKHMDDRIKTHRNLVRETKMAKADGTVTPSEARKLKKLQKKEIRNIKRDMQRLAKASTGIKQVFAALDFDEMADIGKGFLFQMLSVLASGHQDSGIGALISGWCLFINLGDLILDTNSKLDFPIAKIMLRKGGFSKNIPEDNVIENTGKAVVFGATGYLVLMKRGLARRMNTALISSAVVMRGLRGFVKTMLDWDDDDDDGIWPGVGRFLGGSTGGLLMIGLTVVGFIAREKVEKGELTPPDWVLKPLLAVEKGIEGVAVAANKIV